jgi:hypothetical protein
MSADEKTSTPKTETTTTPKAETTTTAAPAAEPAKTTTESTSSAPASYSRGEGQKPITKAYKDNWNLIFGKPESKSSTGRKAKKAKVATMRPAKAKAKKKTTPAVKPKAKPKKKATKKKASKKKSKRP